MDNTVDASKEIFVKKFFPYAPITGGNVYDEFHKMIRLEIAAWLEAKIRFGDYADNETDGVYQVVADLTNRPEDENGN